MIKIPELNSVWFTKSGKFYKVVMVCNQHLSSEQFPVTVAFRDLNGTNVGCMDIEMFNGAMTFDVEATSLERLM